MTNKPKSDPPEPSTYFAMTALTDPVQSSVEPSSIVGSANFTGYPASGTPTNDDPRLPDEPPYGEDINALPALGGASPPPEIEAEFVRSIVEKIEALAPEPNPRKGKRHDG
jgi:hypothetical protein